jgi:SAM-dependent methyltransferase
MLKKLKKIIERAKATSPGEYHEVILSKEEIEQQGYKQYLGGGEQKWESRGAFQLYFLQKMGLQPHHGLLDVGCGPLRAGEHFIRYLNQGRYVGVDYNKYFIRSARQIVMRDQSLKKKTPVLKQVENFKFCKPQEPFDYILAFSVLNHCNDAQRDLLYKNLPKVSKKDTKIYITHAAWFSAAMLSGTGISVKNQIENAEEISLDLKMQIWGWPIEETIFPILELATP